jgi:hypothetical protein
MTPTCTLTAERLRELLHYDPATGVFTWRVNRVRARAGNRAGCAHSRGYRRISIDGAAYFEHRLAFLYMTGAWPKCEGDHENGKRADNRWENLRDATRAQQGQNRAARAKGTSQRLGVSFFPQSGKWRAQISRDGRKYHLGIFPTEELAAAAYRGAKRVIHEFQPTVREGQP